VPNAALLRCPGADYKHQYPPSSLKVINKKRKAKMKETKIQWCHSTVNPLMGCDGCELWPTSDKIITDLAQAIIAAHSDSVASPRTTVRNVVVSAVGNRETSAIYQDRVSIADLLTVKLKLGNAVRVSLVDVVRRNCKCYAGLLGTMRASHAGHARQFEQPKLFPGRMAEAAQWGAPTPQERAVKPWLLNTPRLVFISDMGDALSKNASFDYLKQEIVDAVVSGPGRSHLWLWLSKRPARMAEFGRWLNFQGLKWPDNLVAMTTVTSPASAGRVGELRKVPSLLKGLSCEPLFAPLDLNLTAIDWLIIGGGSDVLAEPFQVEWAMSLRQQCREANTAFFLKQLGKHPQFQGTSLKLEDPHGGDWSQWPAAWRTREIPKRFLPVN
jgi:protein gp37